MPIRISAADQSQDAFRVPVALHLVAQRAVQERDTLRRLAPAQGSGRYDVRRQAAKFDIA
jgi:hypothetical protein